MIFAFYAKDLSELYLEADITDKDSFIVMFSDRLDAIRYAAHMWRMPNPPNYQRSLSIYFKSQESCVSYFINKGKETVVEQIVKRVELLDSLDELKALTNVM